MNQPEVCKKICELTIRKALSTHFEAETSDEMAKPGASAHFRLGMSAKMRKNTISAHFLFEKR